MRVLAVTNLYPNPFEPNRGVFNRNQLRALASGHCVHVISPIAWVEELTARWGGAPPLPSGRRWTCDGIPVEHPRYLYPPKLLRSRYGHFFRRSIRSSFERALAEFRPDVVFSPWAYPDGWAAVALGHQAGLPVVVKVHGCDILWGLSRNPARRRRTAEAIRNADAVVAVSQHLARNAIAMGAELDRVRVVYDGVDAGRFHPGPRAEARARLAMTGTDPLLVFVGSLVPVKGLDVLLAACATLTRQGHRFRCCLVGNGPLRPVLEQQIAQLGLGGVVELCGSRPHEQLADWYRAADLFVLPSRSEGVPCVLLEAMACGTPFVASRVGGIPEVAHLGTGQLVPAEDVDALARAIRTQLERVPRRQCDQANPARSHAAAAAELAGVFERAIKNRKENRDVGRADMPRRCPADRQVARP
jgi:glycosyltransferase involved in cell wall biosynthesis